MQIVSVAEVVKVLRETQHNGFPVIRRAESDGCGQFVGLILRHQILLLLEQRALMEVDSQLLNRHLAPRISSRQRVTKEQQFYEHAMQVYHHSHYPHRRYLSSRPEALDELDLDEILQVNDLERTLFSFFNFIFFTFLFLIFLFLLSF
jgi:chloride channel 7